MRNRLTHSPLPRSRAPERERPPNAHGPQRVQAIGVLHDGQFGMVQQDAAHALRVADLMAVADAFDDGLDGGGEGGRAIEGEEDVFGEGVGVLVRGEAAGVFGVADVVEEGAEGDEGGVVGDGGG